MKILFVKIVVIKLKNLDIPLETIVLIVYILNMPGDRLCDCKGLMKPIGIEKYKNSYKIIYNCSKCHQNHKNIMASDDNFDLIIKLSNVNNLNY